MTVPTTTDKPATGQTGMFKHIRHATRTVPNPRRPSSCLATTGRYGRSGCVRKLSVLSALAEVQQKHQRDGREQGKTNEHTGGGE